MSKINDILDKIQKGEVSPEEAVELIEELKNVNSNPEKNTMEILKGIESGEISTTNGISMIKSDKKKPSFHIDEDFNELPSDEELRKVEKWWRFPWLFALVITIGTGMGMNSIAQQYGFNLWFFLLIIPLLIGLLLLVITWPSENRAWVHVRVKNSIENGSNVNISVPLPILFTSWVFKLIRNFLPIEVSEKIDAETIEMLFSEMDKGKKSGNPFHVHVDQGDGEIVDVYIG